MEAVFAEMPLALFTTLAPIGAGAFIALAVALFTAKFDAEQLKKLDRLAAVPFVFVCLGFVSSLFHLANAGHAFGVLANVGASPLSNEIAAGVVFFVAALVYVVLAFLGKLGEGARKGFAAVVAVLALVFAVFCGLAYLMPTIASWNSMFVPAQIVGFALVGGTALGVWMVAQAAGAAEGSWKVAALVLALVGAVLGAGAFAAQFMGVSGMETALVSGAALTAAAMPFMVSGIVLVVVAAVLVVVAVRGAKPGMLALVALAAAAIGVLLCRLAFYATIMSVGLYVA